MTSLLACSKSIILSSLTHPDYYQLGSPSGNLIARCCWVFLPGKPNSFPPTWTKLSFALNAVSITCSIEINIIFLIVCLCLYVCISITIYPSPYIHHHIFIIIYSSPYIHHHIFITIHPSIHNHSKHIEWESIIDNSIPIAKHTHSHCKTHTFHWKCHWKIFPIENTLQNTHIPFKMPLLNTFFNNHKLNESTINQFFQSSKT